MDLAILKELNNLPLTTVSGALIYQVLGPTAKYLGSKGSELTQKSCENMERVFAAAHKRLQSDDTTEEGRVPPRVLRSTLSEGAFTEDEVGASYLGGVLASSKSESGRDDRGVAINAQISRLSTFQLRLHYVTYLAMYELLQGTNLDFGHPGTQRNRIHFGYTGLILAMGFDCDEFDSPGFDLHSVFSHSLYGLDQEGLIAEWQFDWKKGLECCPTPIGIELFLWANGQGRKSIDYFFNRNFEPVDVEDEEVVIVCGREVNAGTKDGDKFTLDGIDYANPSGKLHVCKIPNLEPVNNS